MSEGLRRPKRPVHRREERGNHAADSLCTCGHRRDEHQEFLPAPCIQGRGPAPHEVYMDPGIYSTREGMRALDAWIKTGCQCLGFCSQKVVT